MAIAAPGNLCIRQKAESWRVFSECKEAVSHNYKLHFKLWDHTGCFAAVAKQGQLIKMKTKKY